jgi:hypothetical protein
LADPLRERIEELRKEAEDYASTHSSAAPRPYDFDDSHYSDEECLQLAEQCFSRWLLVLRRDSQSLNKIGISVDGDEDWRNTSFYMACLFAPLLLRSERLLLNSRAGRGGDASTNGGRFCSAVFVGTQISALLIMDLTQRLSAVYCQSS